VLDENKKRPIKLTDKYFTINDISLDMQAARGAWNLVQITYVVFRMEGKKKVVPGGEATAWHSAPSVFGILSAEIFWRLFSGVPAESSPMCMRMRWA